MSVPKTFGRDTFSEREPQVLHVGRSSSELFMMKIYVGDARKSYDFYTKLVGMRDVVFQDTQHPLDLDNMHAQIIEVCLNFTGSPADPYLVLMRDRDLIPSAHETRKTVIGLKSIDTRKSVKTIKQNGFTVVMEPKAVVGMVVGIVSDPDGYTVQFVQAPSVVSPA